MGLLYEVYSLPWDSGGFKKKFFWLPVEPGSGKGTVEFLTSSGEGSVNVLLDKLDEAGRDLTEIVSDTTSSLIRVIDCLPDGTRTIIDEWVCERPARVHDDARKVTISGPKLKAKAFDSQTIPAFDAPANPTVNPDHIWGGENILSDPGFENANKQNETYEIDLDGATGGSFVLHLDGNSTPSIPFDTGESNLETRVEDLPGITDVLVSLTGAGFRIEFHNPISPERDGLGLLTWTPSLTGTDDNEESLGRTNAGLVEPSSAWTRSQYSDASSSITNHGSYASDGFRLTEGVEPVRSGEFAGRINGLTQFSGIQQLVRVLPSTRHQASIWFYTTDATEEFRLVMRDRYENLIAWQNISNSNPGTWTEVTLDFVTELPDGTPVSEMVFRFAQIIDHNPSPFYVDDAALRPGAPITTWGKIVNALMALKTTEYDWIDHSTVTDTLDSGGVAWPRDESVTAFFGESFGQFWDKGVDLEYEWDLQPKATPSGSLTHDLVWYGPGGLDTSPSAGIYPNSSVTGGDSLTRTPAFNKVRVEGAEGRYVEAEDAASVADIGPLEKHIKDTSLHSDVSLTARANGLLTYEAANRNAVHFQMVEHKTLPRPGTHFKPGDTIPMQLPPGLSKTSKRVQSFSYTNSFPTQYLVTGSRVLKGEAAAYSLLWRLWRRFDNPIRDKGGGGFATGGGGGTQPEAYIYVERDSVQSIGTSKEAIAWTKASEAVPRVGFPAPSYPTTVVTIQEPGYYGAIPYVEWDTFDGGGLIQVVRVRGGVGTVMWEWDSDNGQWGEGTAAPIPCLFGDQIRIDIDHRDASAQDLARAKLTVWLIQASGDPEWELVFAVDNYGVTYDGTNFWTTDDKGDANPALFERLASGAVVNSYSGPDAGDGPDSNRSIVYGGGFLWSVGAAEEEVHKVDPSTGVEVSSFNVGVDADGDRRSGIGYDGTNLFVVENVNDNLVTEYNTSGVQQNTFSFPSGRTLEDITWDGSGWWATLLGSNQIIRMDASFSEELELAGPTGTNQGCHWHAGHLYVMTPLGLYRRPV